MAKDPRVTRIEDLPGPKSKGEMDEMKMPYEEYCKKDYSRLAAAQPASPKPFLLKADSLAKQRKFGPYFRHAFQLGRNLRDSKLRQANLRDVYRCDVFAVPKNLQLTERYAGLRIRHRNLYPGS